MNADLKHKNLTNAILCCVYTVYNILGYGFQVHHEITKRRLSAMTQSPISVHYNGKLVGEYRLIRVHPRLSASNGFEFSSLLRKCKD